jgi:hypothetical protein
VGDRNLAPATVSILHFDKEWNAETLQKRAFATLLSLEFQT